MKIRDRLGQVLDHDSQLHLVHRDGPIFSISHTYAFNSQCDRLSMAMRLDRRLVELLRCPDLEENVKGIKWD